VDSDTEEELMSTLLRTLRDHALKSAPSSWHLPPTVVFAPTRSSCERVASFLCDSGISAVALHGGCSMQHILQQQILLQKRQIVCIGSTPAPAFIFILLLLV
jgi:superfamily II DNA/RNA helicase